MARILVVDDDQVVRMLCSELLKEDGHDVVLACDGKEALEIASRETFDIILTDESMPEVSGSVLLNLLREKGINTPMILMGGYVTENRIPGLLDQGFVRAIQKPFNISVFIRMVADVLATS